MAVTNRPVPTGKKMDEAELKNIVGQKITGSLGFLGGMLSKERLDAEQRYKGEPYGDEQVGRSQVIARDVAESVDSMLPPLLKIFTSTEDMVRFDPRKPQDEAGAKQATEYVNWKWFVKNPGFTILHDWFKDALWKKLGVIKIYWDEEWRTEKETYQGLSDAEYEAIAADETVEIIKHEERQMPYALMMGAQQQPQTVHDVVARQSKKYGCARVVNVPPEEFLIDHRAVTLEEAPFMCHRRKTNLTELKEMGFDPDIVDTLGPDGATDFNMERIERFKDEDAYPYRDDNYVDPSMREVWINECYIKLDYDGDGLAELRQVILAGESVYTLLENEEVDDHPFATLTPIPMPHKVYGMSIADQTTDLQRIKTALFRGALDSIYFQIAPQVGVVEGQVNLDDLLNRRVGGVVRMKNKDALVPIESVPVAQEAFQMIEYVDSVKQARTGVRQFNSTLDADQINPLAKTATQAMLADNAANDRLALIARIFAETGIKRAFRRILELVCKHPNQKEVIRLSGKFVEFDPREWTTEMDISINVGLGTGNRDQQLGRLMSLMPVYQELVTSGSPIVQPQNIYNFCTKLVELSDLKFPERYFTDPAQAPPQQPKPDPKMVQAQGKLQIEQQKMQLKGQEQQADLAHERARMAADIQIENIKAQNEIALARQKAMFDAQLEGTKAAHAMQLEQMRLGHEHALNERNAQHQMALSAHIASAKATQMAETKPSPRK